MIWSRRAIFGSLAMGAIGGAIGGLLASISLLDWILPGGSLDYNLFPLGAVPGFLSCFFVSMCYLKSVRNRGRKGSSGFGALFGAIAGAVAGFVALIGVDLATGGIAGRDANWGVRLVASAGYGVSVGGIVGAVVGSISAKWLLRYVLGDE